MIKRLVKRTKVRQKRAMRIRKKLRGTAVKPRLCVKRSNTNLYAQLIDDEAGVTIASASTLKESEGRKTAAAVGGRIAEQAKSKNIDAVVFDRGPCKFHGHIAAVAKAAREGGLKF